MDEISNISAAQPEGSLAVASKAPGQEDTAMPDRETVPSVQEPSTATLSTESQQTEEPTASTHGTQTPPRMFPAPDIPAAEEPTPRIPTPNTGITRGFTPEDLAMPRNPMVTADSSMLDPEPAESAAEAPREHSQRQETDSVQDQRQETSVAGSLVPPRAEEPSTTVVQPSSSTVAETATGRSRISFEDYLTLSEITFEWGDSYDDKDWVRLRAILAPTLMVDYTDVNGHKWDSMPAEDFVGIMSHIGFIGDPLVHTQHHIGASKWQKLSEEEVVGHHQLRAAHQRYTGLDMRVVENKGHGHAMVKHFYMKVGGEWKLAGLRPTVRWNEFEFKKIFKGF